MHVNGSTMVFVYNHIHHHLIIKFLSFVFIYDLFNFILIKEKKDNVVQMVTD